MLDTDSMRIVHRDGDSTLAKPELTHSYSRDTRTIANRYIHPDDRESFLDLFSPENVSRKVADDPRLSTEYRVLAVDGTYHWISILVLPMPGSSGRLLVLWQDINERKRMEETATVSNAVKAPCSASPGTASSKSTCARGSSTATPPHRPASEPRSGDYRTFHAETIAMIHPADRERINRTTMPKALLEACRAHSRTLVDQYRVLFGENEQLWLENRVFFLEEGDDMTAFFIIRDITEQKRVEEERALEEERYNIALRNTYTEIYEIDLSTDTPAPFVYAAETPMIPVDHGQNGNIHTIAATLIHPEDRERFLTAFIGSNISKEFSEGRMEVPAEYRRLGSDGKWYWVSAFIVPLCGHESCRTDKGILLVRDISEQREEEQRRRIGRHEIMPCATSTTSCTN